MARHPQYDRDTALSKAVGLFWKKGYHGSSMKQIEQALDMRPGSIYATFGSKDGLFSEALAKYAQQGGADLSEHMAGYDSIIEGLQAYLRQIASDCTDCAPARACLIVKTLLGASNTNPALHSLAQSALADIETSFAELLESARNRGEIAAQTDCQRLARLLQSQIMGLRAMAERNLPASELEQLGNDMAAILEVCKDTELNTHHKAVAQIIGPE
ncbi:TetR/AcrR family transcriptional regulator [Marinobacter halophilus]|uniref:TetR family transcriptional regulator n=1 Tax=Marinobacter halophilus TaxID=1323740 RepID=A0A2T1KK45_9GAMM|nr:TetR/AcrR family transcriptional regulator [Marinobacter halophilus]PSF10083.1 TetR family transcriptional regulator [Marinobacter halophilus]GGC67612.1 TetR family transcriptional regulator [Marinobacter halophilus]